MEDKKIGVCLLVSLKGFFFFLFGLLSVSDVWTLETAIKGDLRGGLVVDFFN